MVRLLRMLAILQRIQVQFPPTSFASQPLLIPVPGGPVTSFWPPQALQYIPPDIYIIKINRRSLKNTELTLRQGY